MACRGPASVYVCVCVCEYLETPESSEFLYQKEIEVCGFVCPTSTSVTRLVSTSAKGKLFLDPNQSRERVELV